MQRRVITPYFGAPDLKAYEDDDMDSVFSPKTKAELDQSYRYTTTLISDLEMCRRVGGIKGVM